MLRWVLRCRRQRETLCYGQQQGHTHVRGVGRTLLNFARAAIGEGAYCPQKGRDFRGFDLQDLARLHRRSPLLRGDLGVCSSAQATEEPTPAFGHPSQEGNSLLSTR